jgi:hypothetical protein
MKINPLLLGTVAATALGLASLSLDAVTPNASAQGAPQTLTRLNIDVASVSTGYRASKLVGAPVVNDSDQKIGTIDDLIVGRDDRVPYAIVSVGGFLGVGDKLVAVPFAVFKIYPDKTVLPNATRDSLKNLVAFNYAH